MSTATASSGKTNTIIATTSVGRLEALQVPIPEPGPDEVLVKVEYATLTPFDVYVLDRGFLAEYPQVVGGNSGGRVVKVGEGVAGLEVGDQVVAFPRPTKGFQQYALHPASVLAKVPSNISLVEATTAPDNFVTAFYTLFNRLGMPLPTAFPTQLGSNSNPSPNVPILVYGAGTTSGQYAIELLRLAGYTNIVAVASKKYEGYLKSLGATSVVDYKSSVDKFEEDVKAATGGDTDVYGDGIQYVVDCVALTDSFERIARVISPSKGVLAWLAPLKHSKSTTAEGEGKVAGEGAELFPVIPDDLIKTFGFGEGVKVNAVYTFQYQSDPRLTTTLMPTTLPTLLSQNLIKPNRFRLLDHADLLSRTKEAFELLRRNEVGGEKLVVKIPDNV